jgi:hypothetical protein
VKKENSVLKRENKFLFRSLNILHDNKVDLYAEPDRSSQVIRGLAKGERVIVDKLISKEDRKWLQVELPTREVGYIDAETTFSKTDKITVNEETWSCPKCFEVNPDTLLKCCKCGLYLPPKAVAPAQAPHLATNLRKAGHVSSHRTFYAFTILLILLQSTLLGAVGRFFSNGIDAMIHGAALPRLQDGGTASEHLSRSIQEIFRVLPTWIPALIPIVFFLYTFLLNPIISHVLMERLLPARMRPPKMNDNFMVPSMFLSFGVFALIVYHSSP